MPRKKKGIEVVPAVSREGATASGDPAFTEPVLRLTRMEMMTLRACEAERKLAEQTANIHQTQKELLLTRLDPQRRILQLEAHIRAQRNAVRAASGEYASTMVQIEKRLAIKFSEYSWDDLTGELRKLPNAVT